MNFMKECSISGMIVAEEAPKRAAKKNDERIDKILSFIFILLIE